MAILHPHAYRETLKVFQKVYDLQGSDHILSDQIFDFRDRLQALLKYYKQHDIRLSAVLLPPRRLHRLARINTALQTGSPASQVWTDLMAEFGELVVAFQVNDLVKTNLSSDDVFPEKTQTDFNSKAFRQIFPYYVGETDVQFLGGVAFGEVKTYRSEFKLSKELKAQAELYRILIEGRRKMGLPVEVYYIFPLAGPKRGDIAWLHNIGIQVIQDHP